MVLAGSMLPARIVLVAIGAVLKIAVEFDLHLCGCFLQFFWFACLLTKKSFSSGGMQTWLGVLYACATFLQDQRRRSENTHCVVTVHIMQRNCSHYAKELNLQKTS